MKQSYKDTKVKTKKKSLADDLRSVINERKSEQNIDVGASLNTYSKQDKIASRVNDIINLEPRDVKLYKKKRDLIYTDIRSTEISDLINGINKLDEPNGVKLLILFYLSATIPDQTQGKVNPPFEFIFKEPVNLREYRDSFNLFTDTAVPDEPYRGDGDSQELIYTISGDEDMEEFLEITNGVFKYDGFSLDDKSIGKRIMFLNYVKNIYKKNTRKERKEEISRLKRVGNNEDADLTVILSRRELDPIYNILKNTVETVVLNILRTVMPNYKLATIVAGFVNKSTNKTDLHLLNTDYHKNISEVILHQHDIVPPDFIQKYSDIKRKYKYAIKLYVPDSKKKRKLQQEEEAEAQKKFDESAVYTQAISAFDYEMDSINKILVKDIEKKIHNLTYLYDTIHHDSKDPEANGLYVLSPHGYTARQEAWLKVSDSLRYSRKKLTMNQMYEPKWIHLFARLVAAHAIKYRELGNIDRLTHHNIGAVNTWVSESSYRMNKALIREGYKVPENVYDAHMNY